MPPKAVLEPQARQIEDPGKELAPVVDDDDDGCTRTQRLPSLLQNSRDPIDVLGERWGTGAASRRAELDCPLVLEA